jgi:hypothetical protein
MASKTHSLVLGEFYETKPCLSAMRSLREKGFFDMELYSPYPVAEAFEILGIRWSPMPMLILIAGIVGGSTGLAMQLWCNGIDYPLNVGGRPLLSIPTSIPITFELTILFGALTAFFGLWAVLRLPRLHHPVFEASQFGSAAVNHFWVQLPVSSELEVARTKQALESLGAKRVEVVQPQPGDL